MNHIESLRHTRSLAVALAILSVVGCTDTTRPTQGNAGQDFSGTYTVSWTRSSAACSPRALPAPLDPDTTMYAQMPLDSTTSAADVEVHQSAAALMALTFGGFNDADTVSVLRGTLSNESFAVLAGVRMRTEGPRSGGHTFVVLDSTSDTTKFLPLITFSPIPQRTEVDAHGSQTLTFRDTGSATGVFTTCRFTETLTGQSNARP